MALYNISRNKAENFHYGNCFVESIVLMESKNNASMTKGNFYDSTKVESSKLLLFIASIFP